MNQRNIEDLKNNEVEEKIPMGQETSSIAIQNIDLKNIHALVLFVLLNSFCKENQKVFKIEIYPKNEQGPDKEIFTTENVTKDKNNSEKYEKLSDKKKSKEK